MPEGVSTADNPASCNDFNPLLADDPGFLTPVFLPGDAAPERDCTSSCQTCKVGVTVQHGFHDDSRRSTGSCHDRDRPSGPGRCALPAGGRAEPDPRRQHGLRCGPLPLDRLFAPGTQHRASVAGRGLFPRHRTDRAGPRPGPDHGLWAKLPLARADPCRAVCRRRGPARALPGGAGGRGLPGSGAVPASGRPCARRPADADAGRPAGQLRDADRLLIASR